MHTQELKNFIDHSFMQTQGSHNNRMQMCRDNYLFNVFNLKLEAIMEHLPQIDQVALAEKIKKEAEEYKAKTLELKAEHDAICQKYFTYLGAK